jgi:hypothetical protein
MSVTYNSLSTMASILASEYPSLSTYTNIYNSYATSYKYISAVSPVYTNETTVSIYVTYKTFLAVKTNNGWDTVEAPFFKRDDSTFGALLAIYVKTGTGWKVI